MNASVGSGHKFLIFAKKPEANILNVILGFLRFIIVEFILLSY